METIKIGFGYKARRGKDTACHAIINRLGAVYNIKQYAFADELRDEVAASVFDRWVQDYPGRDFSPTLAMQNLCEWARVSYDTTLKPEPGYPYTKQRSLYQWWGTEYRRAADPDYWVKRLDARIAREAPAFAIISDLRFANEFDFCDYRVRMDRPGFEINDGAHHISEHVLDALPDAAWDAVIEATTVAEVEQHAVAWFLTFRRDAKIRQGTISKRAAAPLAAHV